MSCVEHRYLVGAERSPYRMFQQWVFLTCEDCELHQFLGVRMNAWARWRRKRRFIRNKKYRRSVA